MTINDIEAKFDEKTEGDELCDFIKLKHWVKQFYRTEIEALMKEILPDGSVMVSTDFVGDVASFFEGNNFCRRQVIQNCKERGINI